ncbi:hypothetical protein PRIPAC_81694, partial [Pristionchus pacificus]|uniref:Uncharacterized protein n=1 Tax=Pristionchus pacificus TaxID=54126 RepID=A0A2A6CL86_PRIPA
MKIFHSSSALSVAVAVDRVNAGGGSDESVRRDLASDSIPSIEAFTMKIFHSSGTKELTSQTKVSGVADAIETFLERSSARSVVVATKNAIARIRWDLASDSVPSIEAFTMKIFHSSSALSVAVAINHSLAGGFFYKIFCGRNLSSGTLKSCQMILPSGSWHLSPKYPGSQMQKLACHSKVSGVADAVETFLESSSARSVVVASKNAIAR